MVYLVQENPERNVASASKWGRLVSILQPRENVGADPRWAVDRTREVLRDFGETDYLLLAGDPVAIGIAVCVASERTTKINCLKWDRMERLYYEVLIDLGGESEV